MSIFSTASVLDQVVDLAKDLSDREIIPFFKKISHYRKNDGSPVTAVDAAVQTALEAALPKIVKAPVLGEEMTNNQQIQIWGQRDTGIWCVDPIDGTTNFVNGIPYFAVSIAYFLEGEPVIGRGGAWLGARSLLENQSRHVRLRECVASVDFKRLPESLRTRLVSSPPYASQRNFGAAALEWCDVASGLFDVYVHGNQKIWDFAAGALILSEAGGVMASFKKVPFWSDDALARPVIAARDPAIFEEWSDWLAPSLE